MRTRFLVSLGLLNLIAAAPAFGATEPLIFPVSLRVTEGAYGSNWTVDAWLKNASSAPLDLLLAPCRETEPEACRLTIDPGRAILVPLSDEDYFPWQAVYLDTSRRSDIHAHVRVSENAVNAGDAGTELPLLTTDDFSFAPIHLLAIPASPEFRINLRILSLPTVGEEHPQVRVRVVGLSTGFEWRTTLVTLSRSASLPPNWVGTNFPSAVVPLSLLDIPAEMLQIIVETDSGHPLWSFASVINNTTQRVTVVTPQPRTH